MPSMIESKTKSGQCYTARSHERDTTDSMEIFFIVLLCFVYEWFCFYLFDVRLGPKVATTR